MKGLQNDWRALTDWRAGCGRSARPVRREGERTPALPTPILVRGIHAASTSKPRDRLGEHGIPKDSPAGRQRFEERMEECRRAENDTEVWTPVRRGWCLGEEAFRKELLPQVNEQRGAHHCGAELREVEEEAHAVRDSAGPTVGSQSLRRSVTQNGGVSLALMDRRRAKSLSGLDCVSLFTAPWRGGNRFLLWPDSRSPHGSSGAGGRTDSPFGRAKVS
jgi:hypothetical protein